jgi:hypothetical protein
MNVEVDEPDGQSRLILGGPQDASRTGPKAGRRVNCGFFTRHPA